MKMSIAGLALLASAPTLAADETPGTLSVTFTNLRSAKGMIRACLTRDPKLFLKCDQDPAALKASVAADPNALMSFKDVPAGTYVLAVFHDENSNGKLDTMFGIPKEGVGFSRNPAMSFGPPKYDAAKVHVGGGASELSVKMKYFL